jgi:hypothetical protein
MDRSDVVVASVHAEPVGREQDIGMGVPRRRLEAI